MRGGRISRPSEVRARHLPKPHRAVILQTLSSWFLLFKWGTRNALSVSARVCLLVRRESIPCLALPGRFLLYYLHRYQLHLLHCAEVVQAQSLQRRFLLSSRSLHSHRQWFKLTSSANLLRRYLLSVGYQGRKWRRPMPRRLLLPT